MRLRKESIGGGEMKDRSENAETENEIGEERELVRLPACVFYMKGACVSLSPRQGDISHEIRFSPDFSPLHHKDREKIPTTGLLRVPVSMDQQKRMTETEKSAKRLRLIELAIGER